MMWGCVPTSLICMQLSYFPSTTCWKDCLFSIVYSCLLCQRLIDHRCVGLFLCSLFFFKKIFIWLNQVFGHIRTLSCGIWDLVPWLGIKPRPPALGTCTGPPGKSLSSLFYSIDLYVCFCASTTLFWLLSICSSIWSLGGLCLQLCSFALGLFWQFCVFCGFI